MIKLMNLHNVVEIQYDKFLPGGSIRKSILQLILCSWSPSIAGNFAKCFVTFPHLLLLNIYININMKHN